MRFTKATIILVSFVIISLCIVISKFLIFLNNLDTDASHAHKNTNTKYKHIGKSSENIIWMMQISDLHLSVFHDLSRISELREFCNITLDIIRPSVVLATGDLTDAKTRDGEGSTQFEEEWKIYNDILYSTNVPSKLLWLDIRGNHDNFDVLCINSENNYFRKYSIQGPEHPRSYFYVHKMNNSEKIGFLGVDSCLQIGARRPFNFVGQLTDAEMNTIDDFLKESHNLDVNYMFWFGHYPTSTIQYPDSVKLRQMIANDKRSVAYLCGHLHQIGGLVPNMYAYQKEGYLELELGDWRGNRMIRLMAIDHGQFSFVDVKHNMWPIVLVTNPKNAILVLPGGKSFVPTSSHIRILIFSSDEIIQVRVRVDDGAWKSGECVNGPLYVSEWDEIKCKKEIHNIHVEVRNSKNELFYHDHQFSLDGTRVNTKFWARIFLMPNLGMLFYCFFTISVISTSAPLVVFRYLITRNKVNEQVLAELQCACLIRFIRQISVLTYFNVFFYPLFFYPIYLFFGPWAIVYLVQDKLGVIFSWGLISHGTFIPSWITYPFGWAQIILHAFLIVHLASCLEQRYFNIFNKCGSEKKCVGVTRTSCLFLYENKFYVFVLLLQVWDTYNFWLSYGHLTLVFCPLKTWWIMLAVWLKCKVHSLPKEKLMHVHRIWSTS